jgi:hypothetical protein
MVSPDDRYAVLKTLTHELRKSYIELDGQSRPYLAYEAKYDATTGDPCLITEYCYSSPTSTTLIGVKETQGEWDDAYDTAAGFTT